MPIVDQFLEERWVTDHSLPCVKNHLGETTVIEIILPEVQSIQNISNKKDDFIIKMSTTLKSKQDLMDIKEVIKCIISKMMLAFETNHVYIHESFLINVAYSVLGHAIFIMGKETRLIE